MSIDSKPKTHVRSARIEPMKLFAPALHANAGIPVEDPVVREKRIVARVSAYKRVLRDQARAVDQLVADCVTATGPQTTGHAAVSYVIADHDGEIAVESTSVVDSETDIQNDTLLDCLKETARAMTFDSMMVGFDSVLVIREIYIDHGTVTSHRVTEYAGQKPTEPTN
jgi:hypothetical protein